VFARSLVKIPSVGDQEAPLACGGLTAYGAIKSSRHHFPGRPIAVIGAAGESRALCGPDRDVLGYNVVGVDIGPSAAFVSRLAAHGWSDEAVEVVQNEYGGIDVPSSRRVAGFQLASIS
jgi:D-arabinose 1-dehydrogenase-like Zn-dependent alcohol dehydrogenase